MEELYLSSETIRHGRMKKYHIFRISKNGKEALVLCCNHCGLGLSMDREAWDHITSFKPKKEKGYLSALQEIIKPIAEMLNEKCPGQPGRNH